MFIYKGFEWIFDGCFCRVYNLGFFVFFDVSRFSGVWASGLKGVWMFFLEFILVFGWFWNRVFLWVFLRGIFCDSSRFSRGILWNVPGFNLGLSRMSFLGFWFGFLWCFVGFSYGI